MRQSRGGTEKKSAANGRWHRRDMFGAKSDQYITDTALQHHGQKPLQSRDLLMSLSERLPFI